MATSVAIGTLLLAAVGVACLVSPRFLGSRFLGDGPP
jgi:hypothetical protein